MYKRQPFTFAISSCTTQMLPRFRPSDAEESSELRRPSDSAGMPLPCALMISPLELAMDNILTIVRLSRLFKRHFDDPAENRSIMPKRRETPPEAEGAERAQRNDV